MAGYLIAIIVFMAAIAGAGYQGFSMGKDSKQVEWNKAIAKAAEEKETEQGRQEDVKTDAAKALQKQLAKQRSVNRDLTIALDAHINAARSGWTDNCKLTDSLLNDWNSAARSSQSNPRTVVPDPVRGKPAPAK